MAPLRRVSGSIVPTKHAVHRLREHHARAGRGDVQLAVGLGEPIEPATARFRVGRRSRPSARRDVYVLAPDRQGLFVLIPSEGRSWLVVTYLRFGELQHRFAIQRWPDTGVPAGSVSASSSLPPHHDSKEAA